MLQRIKEIWELDPTARRGEAGLLTAIFISALEDRNTGYFQDDGLMFELFCGFVLEVPTDQVRRAVMAKRNTK